MSDWIKIYSSEQPYKCNFVKALLDEYNIPYQELNKIDSTVVTIGELEIFVPVANEIFVRLLLTQNNLE
ncbi:MAG: DUF2007 domain-containing protein [Bacteroidia bacterium]|nr:DUF2007 domain-containing protein [Bacteroidia bacterium]HQV01063.1 hypothetical protein [Bacteroidia bacterium]